MKAGQPFQLIGKKSDQDFLKTVIHWYIEANKKSGNIEGAIIMAQAALELLYNWLLVEKKKIIIGKDADSISAAIKIRLLINQLQITSGIPPELSALKTIKDVEDAPEAFAFIRNALVHGQEKKRLELMQISDTAKAKHCNHYGILNYRYFISLITIANTFVAFYIIIPGMTPATLYPGQSLNIGLRDYLFNSGLGISMALVNISGKASTTFT